MTTAWPIGFVCSAAMAALRTGAYFEFLDAGFNYRLSDLAGRGGRGADGEIRLGVGAQA